MHHYLQLIPPHPVIIISVRVYRIQILFWKTSKKLYHQLEFICKVNISTEMSLGIQIYVTQLRSGEDPELRNTLKNASYQGGRAANCFNYSPTEGDGGVRAIRSSPG